MKKLDTTFLPDPLQTVVNTIVAKTKPVSVFVYGSRARGDFVAASDYEVGVIYPALHRTKREELAELNRVKNLQLYSFSLEDIQAFNTDTPFPKALYHRELVLTALTIWGNDVFASLTPPWVQLADLHEVLAFEKGYALAALLSMRQNEFDLAGGLYFKALIYGLKVLLLATTKRLALGYDEVEKLAQTTDLGEDGHMLLESAMAWRVNNKVIEPDRYYELLTFLNQYVPQQLVIMGTDMNQVVLS
jgi:predicted nucleotidyltransferase